MSGQPDPVLVRTRQRLLAVTLGLVGALVLGMGAASAFMALRALDQDVDQTLDAAATSTLAQFGDETSPTDGGSPTSTDSGSPTSTDGGGSDGGEGGGSPTSTEGGGSEGGEGGEQPSPATGALPTPSAPTPSAPTPSAPTPSAPTPSAPTPSAPTPSAPTPSAPTPSAPTPSAPTPSALGELAEHSPQASDTFFLVLDVDGTLVSNPSGVPVTALPNLDAVAGARSSGRDLRTVDVAADTRVRLLTLPILHAGKVTGFLQAGYVLKLHEAQSRSLILAILGVGMVGLAGAGLVTYWVVGRALVPIRAAFATERRFVADASHEIRTPAAIIRSSAEVLEREGLVSADGRSIVDGIVAEADRLGRLVDDLLSLAASERGALSVDRRPVDAAEIARTTVARALPLANERGVTLDGPPEDTFALPIHGDAERLVQLLLILLDNAFRHSPPDGRVLVTAARVGRRAEIRVDDQGAGVPAASREMIFEPFARVAGPRRRAQGGAGLGLAIARRLAELHGGTLEVGDAPGGGARFTLGLPLA